MKRGPVFQDLQLALLATGCVIVVVKELLVMSQFESALRFQLWRTASLEPLYLAVGAAVTVSNLAALKGIFVRTRWSYPTVQFALVAAAVQVVLNLSIPLLDLDGARSTYRRWLEDHPVAGALPPDQLLSVPSLGIAMFATLLAFSAGWWLLRSNRDFFPAPDQVRRRV